MSVSTAHKHVHEQTVPATVWVVDHNLNTLAPIVDVFIDIGAGMQKILPLDVRAINAGRVEIEFSSARVGKASLV